MLDLDLGADVERLGDEAAGPLDVHWRVRPLEALDDIGEALSITLDDGWLKIRIADNGRGLKIQEVDSSPALRTGGRGLANMRQRVESLRGRFSIAEEPHGGTEICIEIPIA